MNTTTRDQVMSYVLQLCEQFNLTITDQRITLLDQLVDAALAKINASKYLVNGASIDKLEPSIINAATVIDLTTSKDTATDKIEGNDTPAEVTDKIADGVKVPIEAEVDTTDELDHVATPIVTDSTK